jgi:TolB-like protein/DNA-binding winged helix-turn-helix (wHTH) protein/Flp pilus assembly protein TadD
LSPAWGAPKVPGTVRVEYALQQADVPSGCLRFGVFEADLRTGQLTKHGRRIRLQEQPFQLLAILLEKQGELVTREELQARLWPHTTVDFDHGVNKAISRIREALGDSAENPRFIETVARRGYVFLADVTAVHQAKSKLVADPDAKPAETGGGDGKMSRLLRRPIVLTVSCFAIAVVLAASLLWLFSPWKHAEGGINSLAVLPLENLSNDPSQEYFADGMTEELIAELGQIKALRVISRTSVMSYKSVHKPLAEIARELNVEAVVEGSVLRAGDQVRITAQLIEVPADRHLWSQSYEGDVRDTLGLQSRIARAVVEQIQATLEPREQAALMKSKAVSPEAYEAYLKGRYFWNKRTGDGLKAAITYFSRSVQIDPTFAKAYSGLADSYALSGDWEYGITSPHEAFSQSRAVATKALTLDDGLGEAHTSLAFALDLYGWDWNAADREYMRAIKLAPGYATAHQWYAWHLILTGRPSEGIAEARKAASLDPLSLIISADLADALCVTRNYDEAVQQSRKTLEMDSNFALAHFELGQALVQKNMHDEAIMEFKKAVELAGHSPTFDSNLAYAYAVSGRREEAIGIVKDLKARYEQASIADANIALAYVGLGDHDQAMVFLDKAFKARFNPSILLRPAWDPIRSDAGFKDLLHRIGLPG